MPSPASPAAPPALIVRSERRKGEGERAEREEGERPALHRNSATCWAEHDRRGWWTGWKASARRSHARNSLSRTRVRHTARAVASLTDRPAQKPTLWERHDGFVEGISTEATRACGKLSPGVRNLTAAEDFVHAVQACRVGPRRWDLAQFGLHLRRTFTINAATGPAHQDPRGPVQN